MRKTVSYAVLGQLAFRPWSAYELIKEMHRNFHYFYPRAESGLYEELKKLEKAGLAKSKTEMKGKKAKAVYHITKEGKAALKSWLNTLPEHHKLEFDGLLRMFLSKFGERKALKKSLEKISTDASVLIQLAEKVGNEYLAGKAPFQSEIAERACIFDFLLHYGMMYQEWLLRTEDYINQIENLSEEQAALKAKSAIKSHMKKFELKIKQSG